MPSDVFPTPIWLIDQTVGRTAIMVGLDPKLWDASIGGDLTEQYSGPVGFSSLLGADLAYLLGADGAFLYGVT